MSQRVMPLKCLRPGYRHVRLRDIGNVPLELATLFIYSKITETLLIRNAEPDLLTSNTPHLFRNRILRRAADPPEVVAVGDLISRSHLTSPCLGPRLHRQVENQYDRNTKPSK